MGGVSAANPIGERHWKTPGRGGWDAELANCGTAEKLGGTLQKLGGDVKISAGNEEAWQKTALGNGAVLTYQGYK